MKLNNHQLRQIIREEIEHLTEFPNNPTPPLPDVDVEPSDVFSVYNKIRKVLANAIVQAVVGLEHWDELISQAPVIGSAMELAEDVAAFIFPGDATVDDVKQSALDAARRLAALLSIMGEPKTLTVISSRIKAYIDELATAGTATSFDDVKSEKEIRARHDVFVAALAADLEQLIAEDISGQNIRADQQLRSVFKKLGLV